MNQVTSQDGSRPGDRLLADDDPSSTFVDDAQHWAAVYSELLAAKAEIIGELEKEIGRASPDAAGELAGFDLPLLDAERRRLERRLEFWQHRLRLLEADGVSG